MRADRSHQGTGLPLLAIERLSQESIGGRRQCIWIDNILLN
jgi:hypothetical protein